MKVWSKVTGKIRPKINCERYEALRSGYEVNGQNVETNVQRCWVKYGDLEFKGQRVKHKRSRGKDQRVIFQGSCLEFSNHGERFVDERSWWEFRGEDLFRLKGHGSNVRFQRSTQGLRVKNQGQRLSSTDKYLQFMFYYRV